jgi:hypothetical protein
MAVFNTTTKLDDGSWTNGGFYLDGNRIYTGYYNASSLYNAWFNFPNLNIARGSTIDSAKMSLACYATSTKTGYNVNIGINQAYSPSNPTTATEANAITVGSVINWNIGSVSNLTYYQTPELKSILETYVGNASWNSGQNVMFLIKDNGSSTEKSWVAYNYSSGSYKPYLTVTWTEPSGASFTQKVVMF